MNSPKQGLCALFCTLLVLLTAAPLPALADPPDGAGKPQEEPDWGFYYSNILDVKFREGTQIRLRGGRPQDLGANPGVQGNLDQIQQQFPAGLWQRGHSVSEARLEQLRSNGMAKSGRDLPDLNLYQRLELPGGLNAWQAKKIFERFDAVEAAHIVPKLTAASGCPRLY